MSWLYESHIYSSPELVGIGALILLVLVPLLFWSLAWKVWALWLAARRGDLVWFLVLMVINTIGILEIFYIFGVAKRSDKKSEVSNPVLSGEGNN